MNHTVFYANNRKLSLYIWENQSSSPIAVVQIVHGYFDHASRYDEFAQFLNRNNIVVVAHDLNGHGYTSPISTNNNGYSSSIHKSPSYSCSTNYSDSLKSSFINESYYINDNEFKKNNKGDTLNFNQDYKRVRKTNDEILENSGYSQSDNIKMPIPVNISSTNNDEKKNNFSNYIDPKRVTNDDSDLPPYSFSFNNLGYEEGNMFENDISDIIAISSYCKERFYQLPLILLGIGYGSMLAQYFIEHNKYRINRDDLWRDEPSRSSHSNNRNRHRHHNHHRHHHRHHYNYNNKDTNNNNNKNKKSLHRSSKKNNKRKKNYRLNESTIQRHSLIDFTIDGFILCGTDFMKGILFKTNEFYSDFLFYIKGKKYRTNFLFPSIFQAYKFQTENECLNSDSDSNSDNDSNSDSSSSSSSGSHYSSFIESPDANINSTEHLSVPVVTFSPSEITKEKPLNQWFTRNYHELTKVQQDPLCNFCYSINFYRSLLHGTNKLYKKKRAKGINTKIPILIIAGDHDPFGNYSKGPVKLYNFYKNYNVRNIKLFIYENARHSLLFENNKVEIYHDILKWSYDYVLNNY